MDRDLPPEIGTTDGRRPDPDLLPSRRLGRNAIRAAMATGRGPIVLTGDPGVGKTTLWKSLRAEEPAHDSWLVVEVSPGTGTDGLYRLIGRELTLEIARSSRPALLDFLAERSVDGERWTLVIEEAHNLDAETVEEVRILTNRLGEADGFASILLVGQTALARRLMTRAGEGLRSRLGSHVHLRPLDAEEVSRLLASLEPGRDWPVDLIDRIHHASQGRPARVLDLAGRVTGLIPGAWGVVSSLPATPEPASQAAEPDSWTGPLVGPSKPPIRVEEGMIEVGWQPEAEAIDLDLDGQDADRDPTPTREGTERIDDHYAALQAWQEWATNQGRHPEAVIPEAGVKDNPLADETPLAGTPNVRAEEEHGFAPLGRLFTRLSQENGAD